MPLQKCNVCGDKALGYNFSAITCESCKAFFRRHALAEKQYTCSFNQDCKITVVTRRFCQRCRLKKCFDAGMKSEHILSEEDKLKKRRKIESNRVKRKTNLDNISLNNIKQERFPADNKRIKENSIFDNSHSCFSYDRNGPNDISKTVLINIDKKFVFCTTKMSGTELVDYILFDPNKASDVINRLMRTPAEAFVIVEKIIESQKDALRLISHLISHPGDALQMISKIMNSPFEALTVFTKFMTSPTDGLKIITKIMNSPKDVLSFIKQLMETPEDALGIMTKFMNTSGNTLQMLNIMVNEFNSQKLEIADHHAIALQNKNASNDFQTRTKQNVDSQETFISFLLNNNSSDTFPQYENPNENKRNELSFNFIPNEKKKQNFSSFFLNCDFETSSEKSTLQSTYSLESLLYKVIQAEYQGNTFVSTDNLFRLSTCSDRNLNDTERLKLVELKNACEALYYPIDDELSDLVFDDGRMKSDETNQDPKLLKAINLTAVAIKRLIKMSKKISAFRNMCQEDQVALLKGGCTVMMLMRSVTSFDDDRNTWKIPVTKGDIFIINADILKLAEGNVYEEHEKFIKTFDDKWRMDDNIILIMCAIVLFTPSRARVVHPDVVKFEQSSYYYLLKRYLESIYPGCEARSTFIKLIQKISDIERLNKFIIGVYLNVNPSQVEPLLREMFDLKSN